MLRQIFQFCALGLLPAEVLIGFAITFGDSAENVTVRVHPGAVVVRILAVISAWPVKRSSRFLRERGSGDLTGSVHRSHAAAGASRDPPAGGSAEVVGGRIVG